MILDNLLTGNDFDLDKIRYSLDEYWSNQGLKDKYVRESYRATLSKDDVLALEAEALAANAQTKRLLARGGLFTKRMLKRCDDRFLAALNAGLDVNKPIRFDNKEINLLNQTVVLGDYNRLTLLLSAGAKINIDRDNPRNDTLAVAALTKDEATMRLLLCYMDEPLKDHWLIGLLYGSSDIIDNVMGKYIANRSAALGDDMDNLMKNSISSCREMFSPEQIHSV